MTTLQIKVSYHAGLAQDADARRIQPQLGQHRITGLCPRQAQPRPTARATGPRSRRLLKSSARRRPGRCPGLQPLVREDPLYHWCLHDGGDDLELAAAVRSVLHVDLKAKLQRRLTCTQVMSQLNTRLSELEHHLPGAVDLHALVGQRRERDGYPHIHLIVAGNGETMKPVLAEHAATLRRCGSSVTVVKRVRRAWHTRRDA
ncbi:MAG: hypothetical protein LH632_14480 [Rhodoferax sp.]|nr:hypothetical protein [Rhodoferax sp.]